MDDRSLLIYFAVNIFLSLLIIKISAQWAYGSKVKWGGAIIQWIAIAALQIVLAIFILGLFAVLN